MSANILELLCKSLMPDYEVQREMLQQLTITLLVTFKIGYPTNITTIDADPKESPQGKFVVNTDQFKAS